MKFSDKKFTTVFLLLSCFFIALSLFAISCEKEELNLSNFQGTGTLQAFSASTLNPAFYGVYTNANPPLFSNPTLTPIIMQGNESSPSNQACLNVNPDTFGDKVWGALTCFAFDVNFSCIDDLPPNFTVYSTFLLGSVYLNAPNPYQRVCFTLNNSVPLQGRSFIIQCVNQNNKSTSITIPRI